MKSRLSIVLALAAASGFGALAFTGCSSDDSKKTPAATDSGGGGSCDLADIENPPVDCSPAAGGATTCKSTEKVASCPSNECMAVAEQTGSVQSFRMGRIRLWSPEALLSLAPIAVDPNVNPKCANGGSETFTWLIQVDRTKNTIKTGGSRDSTDGGKTFAFLNEKVSGERLGEICPGFVGPKEEIDLSPVESTITFDGDTFTTPKIEKINVPIFDTSGIPVILPLREAYIKNATIKGSCIGKFEKDYWCDGDSLGWTTGGAIVAKITAEDADRIPIKSAGCQSLCAILANDAKLTDGKVCKRGADGKVPEIGTTCIGGGSCKDAFLLSATFGAYGVEISGTVTPPADAGSDSASDTGGGDADGDAASDAAGD